MHVLADDHDLTTAEAAELGLSRTFVVRLIDDGVIPAHCAGTHVGFELLMCSHTPGDVRSDSMLSPRSHASM